MGLIYKITNKINGKSYIGKTEVSLETRIQAHCYASLHHRKTKNKDEYYYPLHRAIRKYGIENFETKILEDNIPSDKLSEKEIY